MPCYNASPFVGEAIRSVQAQTFADWELQVVDDGSTDDSREVVKEYAKKDKRIHLIKQPNSGACRARNNGIAHAKGEYVKFLDADDVLDEHCLEEQIKQIDGLKKNQIPFGTYGRIDEYGNQTSNFEFTEEMLSLLQKDAVAFTYFRWEILITCPLHRKALLQQVGFFDERLPRHQETDLHFRLALYGVEFVYYPTHTFDYREHISENRISTRFQTGKINKNKLNDVYYRKNEELLISRYGEMPEIYCPSFANYWYGKAREAFAEKDIGEGEAYLQKSAQYMPLRGTRKVYDRCGKIFGYGVVESILRLRLRLLHKVN